MRDAMAKVREFHEKFGVQLRTSPGFPPEAREMLRMNLIEEEFEEFADAWRNDSLEGMADAMADLVYVICGAALEYGIPLAEVFEEVHRSNMLKEGGATRPDGKILKPEGWQRPDIAAVLYRNQGSEQA